MQRSKILLFFQAVVRPRFQVLAIIITATIAILLAYYGSKELRNLESSSQLTAVTPEKIKKWGTKPQLIKTGLYIVNFPEFNLVDNEFTIDAIVWFEFDPTKISLEKIGKFSFEKGEIKKISKPNVRKINEHTLFAEYKVQFTFTSNLTFKFFPLDDHRINIMLVNTSFSPKEVIFVESKTSFVIADTIFTPGWKIMGYNMKTGYEKASLDIRDAKKIVRYPKAIFYIDFRRAGIRQILLILLPLFLIFFIGLFSLGFDPTPNNNFFILSLSSGSLTSMIAYRFIIQTMSPVAGYFMLSDHIFTIFLVFTFIEFILAILTIQAGKIIPLLTIIKGIAFLMFHVAFLVVWYYLLFML